MSMNLHIECDGHQLSIRQTPTQITRMICVNHEGVQWELRGKDARRALYAYCNWIQYSTDGVWKSEKELDETIQYVKEELEYLEPYLKSKKIRVWMR